MRLHVYSKANQTVPVRDMAGSFDPELFASITSSLDMSLKATFKTLYIVLGEK
jgi:hypothetical protein